MCLPHSHHPFSSRFLSMFSYPHKPHSHFNVSIYCLLHCCIRHCPFQTDITNLDEPSSALFYRCTHTPQLYHLSPHLHNTANSYPVTSLIPLPYCNPPCHPGTPCKKFWWWLIVLLPPWLPSTMNTAHMESRKILAHLIYRLKAHQQAPSVYDGIRKDLSRKDPHRLGAIVQTVRSTMWFKEAWEFSEPNAADQVEEEDFSLEHDQDYSTDITYNHMVQLHDIIILSNNQGWDIFCNTCFFFQTCAWSIFLIIHLGRLKQ